MFIVIGGGPAGFFAAIRARETAPLQAVVLLEKSRQTLRKVVVSGGGRCNVTHACYEPREMISHYPRGGRELLGPLHSFGPTETVAWFADHGVSLKTEPDGRMFPTTDSSGTIVECLERTARTIGVEVRTKTCVTAVTTNSGGGFAVQLADDSCLTADRVLIATGGGGCDIAAQLGHTIAAPVPSLFTFRIADPMLDGLAGVSVPRVRIRVPGDLKLDETGPVLITHWGLSGPAVLRLSAWGARFFHDADYATAITVDWCPALSPQQIDERLQHETRTHGKQLVRASSAFGLPKRLWTAITRAAGIDASLRWAELGRDRRRALAHRLQHSEFQTNGQTTNKEEFVTCGGVTLSEVNFKTMESRRHRGLFFAGEVLDLDGVTGGFNFQACWTTGWLAGSCP